jgi:hypothetical protein
MLDSPPAEVCIGGRQLFKFGEVGMAKIEKRGRKLSVPRSALGTLTVS